MSKTGTTRATVKAGDTLRWGKTDWARLGVLTDKVLAAARSDPDAQPLAPLDLKLMTKNQDLSF